MPSKDLMRIDLTLSAAKRIEALVMEDIRALAEVNGWKPSEAAKQILIHYSKLAATELNLELRRGGLSSAPPPPIQTAPPAPAPDHSTSEFKPIQGF